jgi:hypothetical protein
LPRLTSDYREEKLTARFRDGDAQLPPPPAKTPDSIYKSPTAEKCFFNVVKTSKNAAVT